MPENRTLDNLERIDKMQYNGRLGWFAGQNPWAGLRLRQTEVRARGLTLRDGNVTRMPQLPCKPCFGNPAAWLVHGVNEVKKARRGIVQTRCGRCTAREGCRVVSEARLAITPEIAQAAGDFRAAGGSDMLWKPDPQHLTAKHRLNKLLEKLREYGPFTSVNDDYATQWIQEQRDVHRQRATERKRKERANKAKMALRNQEVPLLLVKRLEGERIFRAELFRRFQREVSAPKCVTVDPSGDSADFTAELWLAKTKLKIKGKPTSAYGVAKELAGRDRFRHVNFEVLRGRVSPGLRRVDLLERTRWPSGSTPVWPPFDPKQTLAELLDPAPY